MVKAIAGGAIIPPIMGAVKSRRSERPYLSAVVCLAYLLGLGVFASKQTKT
jgi:fucose permease